MYVHVRVCVSLRSLEQWRRVHQKCLGFCCTPSDLGVAAQHETGHGEGVKGTEGLLGDDS